MLILLVSSMSALGGTERSTQTLSELLTARGHEVHLLGTQGPLCQDIQRLGVKFFEVQTHSNNPLDSVAFVRRLAKLLKTYDYDCIHLQMARPVPLAAIAKLLSGSGAKIIWHSRGIHATTYKYVPRLLSAMGVRAIGNCKAEQEKLVRYGFAENRVGYFYNPCRIEHKRGSRSAFRAQHGFEEGDIVIGSLSRLHAHRGVDYAIRYFDKLCREHADLGQLFLLIAGDGEDRAKLEAQAARSDVGEKIVFIGAIKDTQDFYAGIDLFWNPVAFKAEESAGTGNTIIEAGFQRVPMVSHDWGGVREIIIDGVTGGVAEVGEDEAFVDKTVALLADEQYRKETIERAFSRVTELVGSAACVEKLEHYYAAL